MRKLHITVTQQNILDGVREDSSKCPIACALRQVIPNSELLRDVNVEDISISFRHGFVSEGILRSYEARIPQEAYDFIKAFDDFGPTAVQPIEFDIQPLPPAIDDEDEDDDDY